MTRSAALALALGLLAATPAGATRLEVHTDVSRSVIAARNDRFATSGPPPFVVDLPAGRYELSISTDGRPVGTTVIDADYGIHLRGGPATRTAMSAVLPGAGQWRDDSWWSGAVVGGSVAALFGSALYHDAKAGSKREEADVDPSIPLTDDLIRLGFDARTLEATRDDYLILGGIFYLGNVADALVTRGAIQFRETAPGVVTATYEPAGVGETMLLSAAWPGLGQARQGSIARARVWNFLMVSAAIFWAETENQVEKARSNRDFYKRVADPSDPAYYETVARRQADLNDQKALARTALYVVAGLWAYNIVDAGLLTRREVADSGQLVRNDGEGSSLSVTPGWVGETPGLVLGWKF